MTGTQGPSRTTVARRTVFTAAGGVGLAAALTACGGSDGAESGTVNPADGGATAGSTGGATAGSTGGTTGGTTGGGGGEVIASVADIPEGGGKVIGDIVVTQPAAGEFKAFSSKCTHQGCAVKSVADGLINCPCHNSNFDAGDGSVKSGPATTPLPPAEIVVEGDSIRLA